MGFDHFMKRVLHLAPPPEDPNLSTVGEELKALDWQLSELARTLTDVAGCDGSSRDYAIKRARRHLDTAIQRSFRAQQIAQGLKVPKAG